MGRVIRLAAIVATHFAEDASSTTDAQTLNDAQTERTAERNHAYLKVRRPPPPHVVEPIVENGAVVFDCGKWLAYPAGAPALGPFDTSAAARCALADHRQAVDACGAFVAWLVSISEGT